MDFHDTHLQQLQNFARCLPIHHYQLKEASSLSEEEVLAKDPEKIYEMYEIYSPDIVLLCFFQNSYIQVEIFSKGEAEQKTELIKINEHFVLL